MVSFVFQLPLPLLFTHTSLVLCIYAIMLWIERCPTNNIESMYTLVTYWKDYAKIHKDSLYTDNDSDVGTDYGRIRGLLPNQRFTGTQHIYYHS